MPNWYIPLAIGFILGLGLGVVVAVSWAYGFMARSRLYALYKSVHAGQETLRQLNYKIRLAALGGRADPGAIPTEELVKELRDRLDDKPREAKFDMIAPKSFKGFGDSEGE
jgi:hypothetical protein